MPLSQRAEMRDGEIYGWTVSDTQREKKREIKRTPVILFKSLDPSVPEITETLHFFTFASAISSYIPITCSWKNATS